MELSAILASLKRNRLGAVLVAIQIALTLAILLNTAGVVQLHVARMQQPSGVDETNTFSLVNRWIGQAADAQARVARDLAELRATPGVVDVVSVNGVPLSGRGWGAVIDTRPVERARVTAVPRVQIYFMDEHGANALGLRVAAGRWFTAEEVDNVGKDGVQGLVVLTKALADRLFPQGDALGKNVYMIEDQPNTVVGVVATLQGSDPNLPVGLGSPEFSVIRAQRFWMNATNNYIVRTRPGQVLGTMREVERRLRAVEPLRVITDFKPFTETRAGIYRSNVALTVILLTVSVLLLVITALGIVGLTSYWVGQRRRLIGVRRALGARRVDILRYFQTENLLIVAVGLAAGSALAVALNFWLVKAFAVPRLDLGHALFGIAAIVVLGQCAALWPSLRAAGLPPALATRGGYIAAVRTVLLIDDNPAVAAALSVMFGLHDIRMLSAATPDDGLAMLAREDVGVAIADMNFGADTTSGEEGAALFHRLREGHPDLPIVLLTAWASLEAAVQLIKAGAADYVAKPWDDAKLLATVENLLELAENARERSRVQRERRRRREELAGRFDLCGAVFASDAMERAVEMACRVARADVPVLITGPNGAGKERIAAIVHANSQVKAGPFVALNCGAVPPDLVEAELFGAEAGAYTSANRTREGRFELADGGTLLLDEIGNLPLAGQVKLLRVLETGQYQRLGASRTRTARVRVLSATNCDLSQMIRDGQFREDLLYRLNVIEIPVPALADRPEDIPVLAEHFLGAELRLADDALAALLAHDWPGNVRELRNAIERARVLSRDGLVRATDLSLPPPARTPRDIDEPDRETIEAAMRSHAGNVSRAAQALGLSRQALYRRLERLGLRP